MKRPVNSLILPVLLCSLTLVGCGNEIKPGTQAPVTKAATKTTEELSPAELLSRAQQKTSPEREALLLQAAELYLAQNRNDKAHQIINDITPNKLNDSNFARYSQITASLYLKEGNLESARPILTNQRLEQQLNSLEPGLEASLRELRAQLFERSGQLHEAVDERINLTAVASGNNQTHNQDKIWQILMLMPYTELQSHAAKGSGGVTQGWYSLAALSKNNVQDIASLQASVQNWQNQWRNHPAANNLPKDLRNLQTLIGQQPKKIALLLPLQGRLSEAGEAVRDGFFAAYYNQLGNQPAQPSVSQYDTSKGAVAAYQQAVADGADLVIGPLDKEDVNQISKQPALSVPLLSLNYPDQQPAQPLANFYQFGLAVEDEARQVARQAIQEGHRRALVIASVQEVSERSAQAFMSEWQKLGGTLVGKSTFTSQDKFSENFRHLMLIDESQARQTLLQQQLGTKFEFNTRSRADVDMIFMAVSPAQGRQIKPTLSFHYAGNIPVYATSSVYSGDTDTVNNEDLNGVLFNTLPWVFDNNNPVKQAIAQTSKSSAVYGRLHALGADAFHIYARLPQLKQAPQLRIYGATGSLTLTADGRIEREQMWARFNQGLAEPLATIVEPDNDESGE